MVCMFSGESNLQFQSYGLCGLSGFRIVFFLQLNSKDIIPNDLDSLSALALLFWPGLLGVCNLVFNCLGAREHGSGPRSVNGCLRRGSLRISNIRSNELIRTPLPFHQKSSSHEIFSQNGGAHLHRTVKPSSWPTTHFEFSTAWNFGPYNFSAMDMSKTSEIINFHLFCIHPLKLCGT